MEKTRPNCKVGDTLRVDSDEWAAVFSRGAEGVVTELNDDSIWVRVTRRSNGGDIGVSSAWWSPSSSKRDSNQVVLTVLKNVSDAEVRAAREGLRELLYG